LHGAEHRSSIEGVMVGASDEVQLVALMRAQKRAAIVTTAATEAAVPVVATIANVVARIVPVQHGAPPANVPPTVRVRQRW
jgi:hypothetical protein